MRLFRLEVKRIMEITPYFNPVHRCIANVYCNGIFTNQF